MKIEKYAILKSGLAFKLVSKSTAFAVLEDAKGVRSSVKIKNVLAFRTVTKAENVKDVAVLWGRKIVKTAKKLQSYVKRLTNTPKILRGVNFAK
jgi:hypothetical protein